MNSTKRYFVLSLAAVVVLAACTKPVPAGDASGADASPSSEQSASGAASPPPVQSESVNVSVFNAYASNVIADAGFPGDPVNSFKVQDPVYVGVVLKGEAKGVEVKVEWKSASDDQKVLGSESTSVDVPSKAVASVELTKTAKLNPGLYKALVYVGGAPSWELSFQVE